MELEERLCSDQKKDLSIPSFHEKKGEVVFSFIKSHPDDEGEITWEYELLLDTSEGQAWTAKMETNSPWVNDAFDNFNSMPEDILGHVFTSFESPVWENLGESIGEFGKWVEHSSENHYHNHWWNEWTDENGDGEDDDQTILFGDNCQEDDEEDEESNCTPEINSIVTSIYDRNVLDLGVTLNFNPENWDMWEEYRDDVPNKFTIAMTNQFGDVESTDLVREGNEYRYHGRLSVSTTSQTPNTRSPGHPSPTARRPCTCSRAHSPSSD